MEFKNVLMASSAALALTAASTANAGDYFTVFGGATFQSDVDGHQTFSTTGGGLTAKYGLGYYHFTAVSMVDFSVEHETGFVLGAAYGRDLNRFWRMELEMAYRESQVEQNATSSGTFAKYASGSYVFGYTHVGISTIIPLKTSFAGTFGPYTFGPTTGASVDGSTSFFSIMANVWYDFNIADNWETFVGVGLGMAQANVNNLRVDTHTKYSYQFTSQIVDGTDWVFAYQFGVGAGYTLENGVRLSAQYRYFGTDEAEIEGANLQGESNEFLFGISFPLGN